MNLIHIGDSFYSNLQNFATNVCLWRIFDFQNLQTPKMFNILGLFNTQAVTVQRNVSIFEQLQVPGSCSYRRFFLFQNSKLSQQHTPMEDILLPESTDP